MVETAIPAFANRGEFGLAPTASQLGKLEDYFVHVISGATVTHGTTATPINISIQSGYDYKILLLTGEVWSYASGAPSAIQANPLLTIDIRTQSGTLLSDNPCLWNSIVGTAQLPFYLLGNIVARANTQLQIIFTNFHTSTDYWLMLHIHGIKIYKI